MTVTVHDSALAKSVAGSSVKVVGPAPNVAVCPPVLVQLIVNQLPLTFTGSVKVIVMFASTEMPLAPFEGFVDATAGAVSLGHALSGAAEFRGDGAAAVKSAALLSVSVQPPFRRRACSAQ